jgi:hypothetical protein
LDGKTASISFAPSGGGATINIGTQTLPYYYANPSPYGTYTITVPSLNTSYTLNVPNLTAPTQAAYGAIVAGQYSDSYMVEDWARLTKAYIQTLSGGIPTNNILMANGTCADDVDATKSPGNIGQSANGLSEFLGPFQSGGLCGWPFVGGVGLGAFASHVTDTGTLFVSNMQHIGIDADGVVGKIYRRGQAGAGTGGRYSSDTCGAVFGALSWIIGSATPPDIELAPFNTNYQFWYLTNLLFTNKATIIAQAGTPARMKKCTELIEIDARAYISANLFDAVTAGGNPLDPHTSNTVYFFSGKFINTDDGYEAYVHIDFFGSMDPTDGPSPGTLTDLTAPYLAYCAANL